MSWYRCGKQIFLSCWTSLCLSTFFYQKTSEVSLNNTIYLGMIISPSLDINFHFFPKCFYSLLARWMFRLHIRTILLESFLLSLDWEIPWYYWWEFIIVALSLSCLLNFWCNNINHILPTSPLAYLSTTNRAELN